MVLTCPYSPFCEASFHSFPLVTPHFVHEPSYSSELSNPRTPFINLLPFVSLLTPVGSTYDDVSSLCRRSLPSQYSPPPPTSRSKVLIRARTLVYFRCSPLRCLRREYSVYAAPPTYPLHSCDPRVWIEMLKIMMISSKEDVRFRKTSGAAARRRRPRFSTLTTSDSGQKKIEKSKL